jgi:hypothetical protein
LQTQSTFFIVTNNGVSVDVNENEVVLHNSENAAQELACNNAAHYGVDKQALA